MFVELNGSRADTKVGMMRKRILVSSKQVSLPIITPSREPAISTSFPKPSVKERDPIYDTDRHVRTPEKTRHRWHYSIVFKEYAKPIHKMEKVGGVFTVLEDMMEGQSFDCLVMAKLYSFIQLQCSDSFMEVGGCNEIPAPGMCISMKDAGC